jgi:hypothetical protein
MKGFGNLRIFSLLIFSKMVTLPKKMFWTYNVYIFSAAVFVSNIFFVPTYILQISLVTAAETHIGVHVKTVRIKIDEKFVVKPEENPIRDCRVVHTFRETRRRTNGQRDVTRLFLLRCERFWKCTGLSSVPLLFHTHI